MNLLTYGPGATAFCQIPDFVNLVNKTIVTTIKEINTMSKSDKEKSKHELPAEKKQSSTKGNNPNKSLSDRELETLAGGTIPVSVGNIGCIADNRNLVDPSADAALGK